MRYTNKRPANLKALNYQCPQDPDCHVFWLPLGKWYFGPCRSPICFTHIPPPSGNPILKINKLTGEIIEPGEYEYRSEPSVRNGKGRPRLNIQPELIYDTLKNCKNVKEAALALKCSRAYIYKELGIEKVKEAVKV